MSTKLAETILKHQRCSTDHMFQQLMILFNTEVSPNLVCSGCIFNLQAYISGMSMQIDYGTGLVVYCVISLQTALYI